MKKFLALWSWPKAMSQFVPVAADVIVDEKGSGGSPSTPSQQGYSQGYSPGRRRSSGNRGNRGFNYVEPTPPSPEDLAYAAHLGLQQIEFLFSADNLAMDQYLRSLMDMEGYVPLLYVAQYPNVMQCGASWQGIKEKVKTGQFLEYCEENETIRLKENWNMWLQPGTNHKYAKPPTPVASPTSATADTASGNDTNTNDAASAVSSSETESTPTKA